MFHKLFAFLFGRNKPKSPPTLNERMADRRKLLDLYDNPGYSGRVGKASQVRNSQPDDLLSNPLNPLNPIGFNSPVFYDSDPSPSSHSHCSSSYDSGSSSSSYDSGSSCDSGSSSSSGGD